MKNFLLHHGPFFLALSWLTAGCVTPRICTESGAFEKGRDQAQQGLGPDFSIGIVCKEEKAQVFRNKYEQGYKAGYYILCSPASARDEGLKAGRNGLQQESLPTVPFQICQNEFESLNKAYIEAYKQGMDVFCDLGSASNSGLENGKEGSPIRLQNDNFLACGPKRQIANQAAYQNGYKIGLQSYCAAPQIEETAFQHGKSYQNSLDLRSSYANCSPVQRDQVLARYQQSYLQGLRAYCLPENHINMIKKWVPQFEQPTMTVEHYQACVDNFPDFWNRYSEIYRKERMQFVQMNCTFAAGQQAGRRTANIYTDYDAQTPTFCNAATLPTYQQGFDSGWHEVKIVLCSPDTMRERGYQDGLQGLRTTAPIPAACPATLQLSLENSYRQGYDRGLSAFQSQNQKPPAATQPPPPPYPKHKHCRSIYPVHGPLPSQILLSGPNREVLYPNNIPFMRPESDGSFVMYYPDQQTMLRLNLTKDQLAIYWPNGTQLRYPQRKALGRTLFLPDNTLWYLEVDDPTLQKLNAGPLQSFRFNQTTVSYQWDSLSEDVFRANLALPQGLLRLEFPAATNRLTIQECLSSSN